MNEVRMSHQLPVLVWGPVSYKEVRLQRRQVTRAGEIGTPELWPVRTIHQPSSSQ